MIMTSKKRKAKAERLLAEAYASLAHTEYNLSGSLSTKPLCAFRAALHLLDLDINHYLPSECPKI